MKVLCKWKRDDYTRDFEHLVKIVASPHYVCEKCGRVADKKKWLCEPRPLD